MYMNRNRRMHGCRHRFKRLIMSILVLSMLLTVTGCGGASQTAGSRLNTQNAVDKVLNQKTGESHNRDDDHNRNANHDRDRIRICN